MSKVENFFQSWQWFLGEYALRSPARVLATISLGLVARIGLLLGFLATVKSVVWATNPNSLPHQISSLIASDGIAIHFLLVGLPCSVFLTSGLSRYFFNKYTNQLQNEVAHNICVDIYAPIRRPPPKNIGPNAHSNAAAFIKDCYRTAVALEMRLINMATMSCVLIIVITIGFMINWKVMSIMCVTAAISASLFLFRQHKASQLTQQLITHAKSKEISATKKMQTLSMRDDENLLANKETLGLAREAISEMQASKLVEKIEEYKSGLAMDIGQAALIGIFLFSIQQSFVKNGDLVWIAALAIIIRFILSYAQVITKDLAKLISQHQTLIKIRSTILSTPVQS